MAQSTFTFKYALYVFITKILMISPRVASGGNILMMFQGCGMDASLFQVGLKLGHGLRSQGHNVSLLVTQTNRTKISAKDVEGFTKIYIDSERVQQECETFKNKIPELSTRKDIGMQQLIGLLKPVRTGCEVLLNNKTAMRQIRKLDLDMIIGESFCPCNVILSRLLGGIPYAHFLVVSPEVLPPGLFMETLSYPHERSILERLKTRMEQVSVQVFYHRMFTGYSHVARQVDVTALDSRQEFAASYQDASLWFINGDPVLDYPLPVPPNVVFLGDLTSHSPRDIVDVELNETLVKWRKESRQHIVVSINTFLRNLWDGAEGNLAAALQRLPFQTLWRGSPQQNQDDASSNNLYTGWLQDNDMNDILGLNGTVAFVTTGGRCGVLEAIYHGVPTLCLPLYSDHLENCAKLAQLGMAMTLDLRSFSADEVYDSILRLTEDGSFKENALHASRIFRSKPQPPVERAAFWVDHVLQNGHRHLRPMEDGSFFYFLRRICLDEGLVALFVLLLTSWVFGMLTSVVVGCVNRKKPCKNPKNKPRQKSD